MKNKHDAFVKKVMSDIALAKDYFLRVLPKPVLEVINLETLMLTKDSFLDNKMVTHYADLVFKCSGFNGGGYNICFIFEHKSTIRKDLALQLLQYITGVLSADKKTSSKPEIPIAIVFNHGKYYGIKPTLSNLLGTAGDYLDCYIPSFDYILDDITMLSDKDISKLNNGFLASFLLMLKHYKDDKWIRENPYLVLNRIDIDNRNLIQDFIVYFFNLAPFEEEESIDIIKNIDHHKNSNYMGVIDTMLEKREQVGRAKGREEGRAKGREEGIAKGREEGIAKGREEGIFLGSYKTQVALIKKMYEQDYTIESISALVSMSMEDILKIVKDGDQQ